MSAISYHKLVRDRIPEIIEADGKVCICETLSDEDYIYLLDQKLNEELAEYHLRRTSPTAKTPGRLVRVVSSAAT